METNTLKPEPDSDSNQFFRSGLDNPETLGQVLEEYRPWCRLYLKQAVFGEVGRRVDDSDVIQNTWVHVVRNIESFHGRTEAEFFAWLRACLENNLRNTFREQMAAKRDVRREQDFSIDIQSATLKWHEPHTRTDSPSDQVIRGENALILAGAIERLPTNQRLAVEFRHLHGMKLKDVCAQMGKSSDAVVSLIRRGLEMLNNLLEDSQVT